MLEGQDKVESFRKSLSADEAAISMSKLQADVASIMSRNQVEVQACFDTWLSQQIDGCSQAKAIDHIAPVDCAIEQKYIQAQDSVSLPHAVMSSPRCVQPTFSQASSGTAGAASPSLALRAAGTASGPGDSHGATFAKPGKIGQTTGSGSEHHHGQGTWRKMVQKNIEKNNLKAQNEAKANKKGGKRKHKAGEFIIARKQQEATMDLTPLQQIVAHRAYEWMTVTLVVLNAIFMGIEVQVMCHKAQEEFLSGVLVVRYESSFFRITTTLFCIAFVMELGVRVLAEKTEFFRTSDYMWNWFDTVIVFFSVLEQILDIAGRGSDLASVSILRVLRVVRVVKVLRVIRLLSFFRELRMMVASIIGCFKSLVWAMMVLLTVFYIFGLSFATGTYDSCWVGDQCGELTEDLQFRFGRLDLAMMSLFMAITGGIDWGDLYVLMKPLPSTHSFMFLVFISFSTVAMLNVVTGIFVDCAMKSSQDDREVLITEQIEVKNRALQDMMDMFGEMDDDGSGLVTLEEFESHLNDERAIAYFENMKLDVTEISTLCMMLDLDQSGNIDMEEFVVGCEKLKGESRSLDIAIVNYELKWLTHTFLTFADFMEQQMIQAANERQRADGIRNQLLMAANVPA